MAEEYLTDDEQVEAVKRWTAQNGLWVLGGIVVGAALLFGWRYYDEYRNQRALKAAALFGDMTVALDQANRDQARRLADDLIKDYANTPYADQAQLAKAKLAVEANDLSAAVTPLATVMQGSGDAELRNIARLSLARVQIDQGKPDAALSTLADANSAPFASRYHEVRGDALYAKKDLGGALTEYRAALAASDPRSASTGLVQLKISDIGAPPPATAKAAP
jgi:predicted negative regulator of RcsB-dependent stress response